MKFSSVIPLYILNLCDLALTLYALQNGGVELNPLMQNPAVMVAWKTVGVGVLCGMLHVLSYDKRSPVRAMILARRGLRIVTGVYALIIIYHLSALSAVTLF